MFHFASLQYLLKFETLQVFIDPPLFFLLKLPFGVCVKAWGKLDFILLNVFSFFFK